MRSTIILGVLFASVSVANLASPAHAATEGEKDMVSQQSLKQALTSVGLVIGHSVENDEEGILGRIEDILLDHSDYGKSRVVLSLDSSVSDTPDHVAVPLSALHCLPEGRLILLGTTRQALRIADRVPPEAVSGSVGRWPIATKEEFAESHDLELQISPSEHSTQGKGLKKFVRDPIPKGGEALIALSDSELAHRIDSRLDLVHVKVRGGVTYLYGSAPSDETRLRVEATVRRVPGVHLIESHLTVRHPYGADPSRVR